MAYEQYGNAIDDATRRLMEQYAELARQANAVQGSYAQQAQANSQQAISGFQAAAGQGQADVRNQGFDSNPLAQNALAQTAGMQASSQNLQDFYAQNNANLTGSLNQGQVDAQSLNANSKYDLALSMAEDAASGGGGGGGGGYGRGGYGSGGGDVPAAGDATNIAKALAVLPDVTAGAGRTMRAPNPNMLLDAFLNGTGGKGITLPGGQELLPANFGHVARGGDNAPLLANKYMQQYDKLVKQGLITDSSDVRDHFMNKLRGETMAVGKNSSGRQTKAESRRQAALAANLRGYDVGPPAEQGDGFDWKAIKANKKNLDAYLKAVTPKPGTNAPADRPEDISKYMKKKGKK